MENTTTHIEALYEKAKTYTNTTIELYKLNAIDTTADVVSSLASRAALVLVFFLFTLFVNIAVSLLIGNLLGATYLGFLVVSLFYLAITIVLFIFGKKYIQIPITNLVIAKLLKTKLSNELDYKKIMSTFRNYNLELDGKIEALKLQRKNDFDALNMQFNKSYQELRPAKIAKRVFNDLASEPEIKTNLMQTVLSIAGGYLSKKLLIGKSNGLFKSILGYGVQYLSTKLISKKINSEA